MIHGECSCGATTVERDSYTLLCSAVTADISASTEYESFAGISADTDFYSVTTGSMGASHSRLKGHDCLCMDADRHASARRRRADSSLV